MKKKNRAQIQSHARFSADQCRTSRKKERSRSSEKLDVVVMFALMLGVGAIIGTYINQEMNMANPQVAGVQIEAE